MVDGTQAVVVTYVVSSTGDSAYNDVTDVTRSLDVTDVDVAGLVLAPDTPPSVAEGATETVMVKLANMPAADVNVAVSVSDATELSFSPASLVFTSADWNTPKAVELTGKADSEVDGTQAVVVTYAVSSTGDSAYNDVTDVTRSLNVTDGDVAGLVLVPNSLPDLAEGATETVMVKLANMPAADVTVDVSSADPDDPGDTGEVSLSTARLVFLPGNWSTPQPVVLTGVEDSLVDGTQAVVVTYDISSTDGSAYDDLDSVTQSLDVTDANTASFVFIPSSLPNIATRMAAC